MQLNQILGRFQSLSENCLMYLHLEQRVRCFLFLAPLFKGAKFNVGNSDALETDVEVERLETELKQIEDVLQGTSSNKIACSNDKLRLSSTSKVSIRV